MLQKSALQRCAASEKSVWCSWGATSEKMLSDANDAPQAKKVCYAQDVQHVKKGCDAHDCSISPRTEHGPTSLYISR